MLPTLFMAVGLAAVSLASALTALVLISRLGSNRSHRPLLADSDQPPERTIFLFDNHELLDATAPARALIGCAPPIGSDRDRFNAAIAPFFGDLSDRLSDLEVEDRITVASSVRTGLKLLAEQVGACERFELVDEAADNTVHQIDAPSFRANQAELELLRETIAETPILAWRTDAAGSVAWANRSYLRRAAEHEGLAESALAWPLPRLFPAAAVPRGAEAVRLRVLSPDTTRNQWYECRSFPKAEGALWFGLPIDPTVRAENALREFVQTLTKTFAHLPIGLAIFDRQRQLALFNPALIDLTTLSADVLSTRPTLFAFLDYLREARIIPEPKDYPTWRQTMNELEKAASSGLYEETWTLSTGQTYHVSGRPHPDGAVAFLFEDISAEISLTRRFRSEIELGQSVIDQISSAIAVFSPAGVVVMSNAAYAELWGADPHSTLGSVSAAEAIRRWEESCQPSSVWGDLRGFVADPSYHDGMSCDLCLHDGRRVECRLSRLPSGNAMATFSVRAASAPLLSRRLRRRARPPREAGAIVAA